MKWLNKLLGIKDNDVLIYEEKEYQLWYNKSTKQYSTVLLTKGNALEIYKKSLIKLEEILA